MLFKNNILTILEDNAMGSKIEKLKEIDGLINRLSDDLTTYEFLRLKYTILDELDKLTESEYSKKEEGSI